MLTIGRAVKLALLIVLLLVLCMVIFFAGWYVRRSRTAEAPEATAPPWVMTATPTAASSPTRPPSSPSVVETPPEEQPRYVQSITGVQSPIDLAVSPDGKRLYVTEGGGQQRVLIFETTGRRKGALDRPGDSPLPPAPAYVAVAADGRVYVSDRMRRAVLIYEADGRYVGPLAVDMDWSPLGLAFDRDGNLYVSEVSAHRVVVLDPGGQVVTTFGRAGQGAGELMFPNGLAVDGQGRVFVADSNNARVQIFDRQGGYVGQLGADETQGALGLAFGLDIAGERLFVVDTAAQTVRVYDVAGSPRYLFSFGQRGVGEGYFNYPMGVAAQPRARRLYIADRDNDRIQVWEY